MEKFNRYLKDMWAITQAIYKEKKAQPLNISIGNVSGDMDSVVCSIILGYYLTYSQGFYEEEKDEVDPSNISEDRLKKLHVPILNMNQGDLEARSDIIHHFEKVGVNWKEIPACDIIDLEHYAKESLLTVSLVDHNEPDCTQEYMIPLVERLHDHHHDKNQEYPNIKIKDLVVCGSAASLITKVFHEDSQWKNELLDKDVALFTSAPIIIDTLDFDEKYKGKKWDDIDRDMMDVLLEIAGDHIPKDYFDTLYDLKTDIQTNINLGIDLILRKDYKNYLIGDLKMGISTVFIRLEVIEKEFGGDKLREALDHIMEEKGLSMFTILTQYEVEVDGKEEDRRQVLSYAKDDTLADKLRDLYDHVEEINLDREDMGSLSEIPNAFCWQNHSLEFSRKKFEPFIRRYFANHS